MKCLRLYLIATLLLLGAWGAVSTFVPAPLPAGENIKSYAPTPVFTTLNGSITAGATSITVVDATKLYDTTKTAYAFRISIDQEYLYVTSVSGNVLTIGPPPEAPSGTGRGIEGSTAASHNSGASVRAPATAQTWLNAYEMATQVVNVSQHAVLSGNSAATNSANIATMIAAAPVNGCEFYFPPGQYNVNATVDFSALRSFTLRGVAYGGGSDFGSTIQGDVNGTLVKHNFTNGRCHITDMILTNNHVGAGTVLDLGATNGDVVENSQLKGFIGISLLTSATPCTFANIKFSASNNVAGSIGLLLGGTGHTVYGCDFVGWDEGVRVWNAGVSFFGCRFEVNKKAIRIGIDNTGASYALSRAAFVGISMEANDVAISVESGGCVGCLFSAIGVQGSTNAPSGQSITGIDITGALTDTTFTSCLFNGSYSKAAWRINNGTNMTRSAIAQCEAANSIGTAKVWDVGCDLSGIDFYKTNYTIRADDTVASPSLRRFGTFQYLGQIDYLNASQEGKNIRGIGVALGNGVTSYAVAFSAAHGSGQTTINTATAVGGGTLGAGTYYYLATARTAHGESAGSGEQSVVLNGTTTTAASISFFGFTQDGWKRRVYRGTASGVYDGYYELPLNSSATFTDTGAAFTGRSSPPGNGVDSTSMQEPDANYGVWVTPSWGTTVKVTGKATTGFTATFGTATPDANQTIDWLIVRRMLERSCDGYQVGSRKGLFHAAGVRAEEREAVYSLAP